MQTRVEELYKKDGGGKSLTEYPNDLPPFKGTTPCQLFRKRLFHGLNILMMVVGLLCIAAFILIEVLQSQVHDNRSPIDITDIYTLLSSVMLLILAFSPAFIHYYHEKEISSTIDNKLSYDRNSEIRVLRKGDPLIVTAKDIVPGDVVTFQAGDTIPADLRIIEANQLLVSSFLSRDSETVLKTVDFTDEDPLKTSNLLFYSNVVLQGNGSGIVIAVGTQTLAGQLIQQCTQTQKPESLSDVELRSCFRKIRRLALFLSVFVFLFTFVLGYHWLDGISFFIIILFMNIPEGILVITAVFYTKLKNHLKSQNCLVKHMESLHTLGRVNIVCVDTSDPITRLDVAECKRAGIRIILSTVDDEASAKQFALSMGIISEESVMNPNEERAVFLQKLEIQKMKADELDDVLRSHSEIVFYKMGPKEKQVLIKACQRLGAIVATSGFTVIDAIPVKQANVGITYASSTTTCKLQADIILQSNKFETFVEAAIGGKTLCDNLKKAFAYNLTSHIIFQATFFIYLMADMVEPSAMLVFFWIDLVFDLLPALFISFELKENIEIRQRNPEILTCNLLARSYFQIGLVETFTVLFVFFVIMGHNGFFPAHLFGIYRVWHDHSVNDLVDSYGQEWSFADRKALLNEATFSVLLCLLVTQLANAISCRTKYVSIFQSPNNLHLYGALVVEVALTMILCLFGSTNWYMLALYWTCGLPFALFIIFYDELRKVFIRVFPHGCVQEVSDY